MASTLISVNIHFVFSTKNREKIISDEIRDRLWPYMGGIAKQHKMIALAAGGTDDHAHILLSIPATVSLAKAIQLIKGGSSKWINDEFQTNGKFSWQEGYAAFSVSPGKVQRTISYILNQQEHHRKNSFRDEYYKFLQGSGIEYDERYVLG